MKGQHTKIKNYRKSSHSVIALGMGALLISLFCFVPARETDAAETENQPEQGKKIEITIGYEGMKSYSKSTLLLGDLEKEEFDLQTHRAVFTWIADDKSCMTTEAEGIYLSDLLDYAQVDQDSIYSYDFTLQDSDQESDEDVWKWDHKELFAGTEGDRYTFAGLFRLAVEQYNDCEDKEDYWEHPNKYLTVDDIFEFGSAPSYKNQAWNYRSAIEPMLAVKSYSAKWEKGENPPTNLDYTKLEVEDAPVLFVGQAAKDDVVDNTKAVSQINIYFSGKPEISVKTSNLNGTIGTKGSIKAQVTTPDKLLTEMIESEITYTSSNPSVATVDEKGNVEIIGEGKASIAALYDSDGDGLAETVGTAAATGKIKEEAPEEGSSGRNDASDSSGGKSSDSSGRGNASGSSGGSSGSANGSGNAAGTETGISSTSSGSGISYTSRKASTPSAASGTTGQTNSNNRTATAPSGGNNNTATGSPTEENASDTVALRNATSDLGDGLAYEVTAGPSAEQNSAGAGRSKVVLAFLAGGIALVGGAILVTGNYWMQTEWTKRAKKLFEKQG